VAGADRAADSPGTAAAATATDGHGRQRLPEDGDHGQDAELAREDPPGGPAEQDVGRACHSGSRRGVS
jgi:hypothetical protein